MPVRGWKTPGGLEAVWPRCGYARQIILVAQPSVLPGGEARAKAVGPELVARSDDAGETRWYCGEVYLRTGMPIYGNVT